MGVGTLGKFSECFESEELIFSCCVVMRDLPEVVDWLCKCKKITLWNISAAPTLIECRG